MNVSFVYASKKPKASKIGKGSLEQKILDAEWEITLLCSQLEDAEMQLSKINLSTDEEIPADKQSSSFQNLLLRLSYYQDNTCFLYKEEKC